MPLPPHAPTYDLTMQGSPKPVHLTSQYREILGLGGKRGGGGKGQPQIRGKYLLFKQTMKEFGPRGGREPYHPLGSANDSVIIAHLIYPNRPVSISK